MPKDTKAIHFIFQITLHIDDIKVLNLIKDKLEIGNVTVSKSSSSYKVHSFKDIQKLLLIFNQFPLLTHKQIDYDIWRQAIEIKQNHLETQSLKISKNKSFDEDTYNKLLLLKTSLNKPKLDSSLQNYIIHKNMITDYWLLGFVEGDGSFFISNNSATFSLRQKDKQILEIISQFLEELPICPPLDLNLFKPDKPQCSIRLSKNSKNEEAYSLTITDADVLFQYILPFFKRLKFLSRKNIDFKL